MKLEEKLKARRLRSRGQSYGAILRHIPVSKSTLSLWLKDIELTDEQQQNLLNNQDAARYKLGRRKMQDRIERTNAIIEDAKREFHTLTKNPLFLSGLSLYWAEGDKNKNERVKFTNSDPAMIGFMMKWFRNVCGVPESKFRIAIHAHDLLMNNNIKNYWQKITRIPNQQFNKIFIKKSTLRQRRNVLYNGTCAIVISDRTFFRKIVGWKLAMIQYLMSS